MDKIRRLPLVILLALVSPAFAGRKTLCRNGLQKN